MASDCGSRLNWAIQYRQPSPAPKAYAGESFDNVSDSDSDEDKCVDGLGSASYDSGARQATGRAAASSTGSVPPSTSFFCRQGVNGNAGLARRSSPDIATHHAEGLSGSDGVLFDDEGDSDVHFHYPTTAADQIKRPPPSQHAARSFDTVTDAEPQEIRTASRRFQPSPAPNHQQSATQATAAAHKREQPLGVRSFPTRVFKAPSSTSGGVVAIETLNSPLDSHSTLQPRWEGGHPGPIMPPPRFTSSRHAQPQDPLVEDKGNDEQGSPKPLPPDEDIPPMLHLLRDPQQAFVVIEQDAGTAQGTSPVALPSAPIEDEVVESTSHVPGSARADSALYESTADQQVNDPVAERGNTRPLGRTSHKAKAAITLSEYLESTGKTRHTCDKCGTILTPEAIAFMKASDAAAAARDRKVAFKPPPGSWLKQQTLDTTRRNTKGASTASHGAEATSTSGHVVASSQELPVPPLKGGTSSTGLSAFPHAPPAAAVLSSETPDATWDGLERLADLPDLASSSERTNLNGFEGPSTMDMAIAPNAEFSRITLPEQGGTKLEYEGDITTSLARETLSLPERGTSPVLSDVTVKHGVEVVRDSTHADLEKDGGERAGLPKTMVVGGWTVSRTTTPSSAASTPSTAAFSPGPLSSPISSVSSQESSPIGPADRKPYKVSGWTITTKNTVTTAFVQQSVLAAPQYIHPDRALMLINVEPQSATVLPPQKISEPKGLGIGWGDEEPSTPTKAPNLAWDPEVAIKKLPSPTNPTGVRGMGRSPSNSAAPAERVLAPPLNQWRDSFEHVRSPVDRPISRTTANQSIQSSRIEHQRADAIPSASLNAFPASVHDSHVLVSSDLVQPEHTQSKENTGRESPFKARDHYGSPVFKHFAASTYGDFRGSKASQWANSHSRPASAAAHVPSTHEHSAGWDLPALASKQGRQLAAQDGRRDGWGQIIEKVKESASYVNSNSLTTSAMSSFGMPATRSPPNSVLSSRSKTPTPSSSWKTAKTSSQDFNMHRVSSPMPFIPKSYQGWQKPQVPSQAGVQPNQEGPETGAGWSMPAPTFQAPARTFVSSNSGSVTRFSG